MVLPHNMKELNDHEGWNGCSLTWTTPQLSQQSTLRAAPPEPWCSFGTLRWLKWTVPAVWLNWNDAKAAKQLKIPPTPAERDAWRCRTAAGGSHLPTSRSPKLISLITGKSHMQLWFKMINPNKWLQYITKDQTSSRRTWIPKAVRGFKELPELLRKLKDTHLHITYSM